MQIAKIILAPLMLLFLNSCDSESPFPTFTILSSSTGLPSATALSTSSPTPSAVSLNPYIVDLHMLDEKNGWAFARTANDRTFLFRSKDGGEIWNSVYPCDVIRNYFFLSDEIGWVIGWDFGDANPKLYRTTDGGQTWSDFLAPDELQEVYFTDLYNGWARAIPVGCDQFSCDTTLFETYDGGRSWSQLLIHDPFNRKTLSYEGEGGIVLSIWGFFSFRNHKNFWAVGEKSDFTTVGSFHLLTTWDGGQDWESIKLSLPSKMPNLSYATIDPPLFVSDNDAYLSVKYGSMSVFTTHDGGHSWKAEPAIVQNVKGYNHIDFVSPSDGFVICGDSICSTDDGAQTWRVVSPNPKLFDSSPSHIRLLPEIDFVTSNTGFALVPVSDLSTNLYKTSDGGANWSLINLQFK